MFAAQHQLTLFYGTAAALLTGFLITWVGAEARAYRDERLAERSGGEPTADLMRLPRGVLVPIALCVGVGAGTALWVQLSGEAHSWQTIVVCGAIGVAFVSFTCSIALSVDVIKHNVALARRFRALRVWGPPIVALVVGFAASPLALGQRSRGAEFRVYGTCLARQCGLKQRSGPGANYPEVDRHQRLEDGHRVLVVCQDEGPAPRGFASRVWDRLPNNRYVSDAFVDTPNRSGGFSEALPRC